MAISCHFRDCNALLVTSLTHVSGAIASVQTFTFAFTKFEDCMAIRSRIMLHFVPELCRPRDLDI